MFSCSGADSSIRPSVSYSTLIQKKCKRFYKLFCDVFLIFVYHLKSGHPLSFRSSILPRKTSSVVPKKAAKHFRHINCFVRGPNSYLLIPMISLSVIAWPHLQQLLFIIIFFILMHHVIIFTVAPFPGAMVYVTPGFSVVAA